MSLDIFLGPEVREWQGRPCDPVQGTPTGHSRFEIALDSPASPSEEIRLISNSNHKQKWENLWNGEQECDESVECIVQSFVPIQPEEKHCIFVTYVKIPIDPTTKIKIYSWPEDPKVYIWAAERSFQHWEANGDSLKLEWIHLVLRNLDRLTLLGEKT